MERAELLERIAQHYNTYWQGDLADLEHQLAPDFVNDEQPEAPPGWQPVGDHAQLAREAFPDMHVTVVDAVVEGSAAAVLATWEGTHTGEFPGMPATGRHVVFQSIVIGRFDASGRIVRRTARNEEAAMMQQLAPAEMAGAQR